MDIRVVKCQLYRHGRPVERFRVEGHSHGDLDIVGVRSRTHRAVNQLC